MIEPPAPQNTLTDPFNTFYDINDQTPVDKIPKEFYKWEANRKKEQQEKLSQLQVNLEAFSKSPDIEDLLIQQAHQTISNYDDHIIRVVFHVGLSAYFKPLNLGLKAESGSGKSYSTLETIKFLPDEDIQTIGSQTPKVISHENGIRKSKDGRLLLDENEPKKPKKNDYADLSDYRDAMKAYETMMAQWETDIRDSIYEVDLRNKVLLFLESVNIETFRMFKTTMSHDNDYIDHKYVDEHGRVHITRLVGAPAIIFNSVDNDYVEEFATRTLSATPSTRAEKIHDSMRISNNKGAYPWLYQQDTANRQIIKEYIRKIKHFIQAGKINVAIPFDGLHEGFSKDIVRDMRDFNKYMELLPSYALFKLFQRPIVMIEGKRYLLPTLQDAIEAKNAFDSIIETTKTSTDFRVLDFYHSTVTKHPNGCDAEWLTDEFNKGKKRPVSVKRVREWLTRLEEIGYVDIREAEHRNDKGYIDKRYNNYVPLRNNTRNTAILQTAVDLTAILQKGFETWLKNTPFQTDPPPIMLNLDGSARILSLNDVYNIINTNSVGVNFNGAFSKPNSPLIKENKPLETAIQKTAVKGALSKTLFFNKTPRKPGVYCSKVDNGGYDCTFEAEYSLNGNLYCTSHFKEQVKFNEENGFLVKEKAEDL